MEKKEPWVNLYGDWKRDLREGKVGYNFTVRIIRSAPALSKIGPETKVPQLTPLGECVERVFRSTLEGYSQSAIWVRSFVIMPDHLHCCVWVKQRLAQGIRQYFTKALLFSQREAEKTFSLSGLWDIPAHLFMCYSWEVFLQKIAYNEANVARWKMDHFQRTLSHPHILGPNPKLTPGIVWQGFGHLSLLEEPRLLPCYISSSVSPKQIALFTRLARSLIREGWVLVGGFVSPRERALLAALRAHTSPAILHVAPTRLPEKKVSAALANALVRGRFLRITSAEGRETCTRDLCVWHNLWIETLCPQWRTLVLKTFRSRPITPTQEANLVSFLHYWPAPKPSAYLGPRPLP